VLDWMYRDDQLGVQAKLRLVSMEAMNGGLGTYKLPVEQPIMHLVAMSDDLRLQVLGCECVGCGLGVGGVLPTFVALTRLIFSSARDEVGGRAGRGA
jgi:hypothetical protein